ncbi:MAG: phasin family protein [Usitatibacter sp.]
MFKIDQFTAANEAAINQFAHFAQLSLANLEKFAQLGLGAARDSVEQATVHAQSLAGAKDVHEVIALNSAAIEPVMKRAYVYSRTAYDTASETNNEVKRVLEAQSAEYNRAAVAALE